METVLVTGGAGFIGSHTCKGLPRTASYRSHLTTYREAMPISCAGVRLLTAIFYTSPRSMRPSSDIAPAPLSILPLSPMSENRCRARSPTTGSMSRALSTFSRRCCASAPAPSCSRVRAQPTAFQAKLPIAESAPQRPINPYGRSKLAGEQILADARSAEELRVAMLRYFNAAGADPVGFEPRLSASTPL